MSKQIVLISCVSKKQRQKCMAKDLYISSLFKKSWVYANKLNPDAIYILSAEHHLLHPETPIEPYEKTLNECNVTERKTWTEKVLKQMKAEGLDVENDKFIILAGKKYYQYLIDNQNGIKNYTLPLQGKGGIGCILKYLTEQTR